MEERQDIATRVLVERMQHGFRSLEGTVRELAVVCKEQRGVMDDVKKELGVVDVQVQKVVADMGHVVTTERLLALFVATLGLIFGIVWTVISSAKNEMKESMRERDAHMLERVHAAERRSDETHKLIVENAQKKAAEPVKGKR